jgi:hypothetical protein
MLMYKLSIVAFNYRKNHALKMMEMMKTSRATGPNSRITPYFRGAKGL